MQQQQLLQQQQQQQLETTPIEQAFNESLNQHKLQQQQQLEAGTSEEHAFDFLYQTETATQAETAPTTPACLPAGPEKTYVQTTLRPFMQPGMHPELMPSKKDVTDEQKVAWQDCQVNHGSIFQYTHNLYIHIYIYI